MHIAETNLQTTGKIWDRSKYGNVDGKHFGMTNKNGTVLHIEMLMEKSWRLEQGIIYDCYVKYVLE